MLEAQDNSQEIEDCARGLTSGVAAPSKSKTAPAKESAHAKNQAAAPSKSILLARLRARLAEQGK